jgi:hypothetical protein
MDGGVSRLNLATQNALHPLHGMSVDVNQSWQNGALVQVEQLGTGTGASCERAFIGEGEDSAITHCHGAHHSSCSVHRNDVTIANEQVSIRACLGDGGSEPEGRKQ